ncbi:hypothetical protein [Faecalibacillus intestinalis]
MLVHLWKANQAMIIIWNLADNETLAIEKYLMLKKRGMSRVMKNRFFFR